MVIIDPLWYFHMASPVQARILKALSLAIRPLASALLAAGIGYREFSEISKAAFVDAAASDFGIRGRPTNNSRIAVITGLTRKQVKSVRQRSSGDVTQDFANESPASVVLHKWNNDRDYLDDAGNPIELSYESFKELVHKYAGDIPPGAMRTELKRVNSIEELAENKLKVIKPFFVPQGLDDRLVIGLEDIISTANSTLAYNCDPARTGEPRFQRVASVDGIDEEFHAEIAQNAKDRLTKFGLDFCSFLDGFERKSKARLNKSNQIGIGLYYYQVENSETE